MIKEGLINVGHHVPYLQQIPLKWKTIPLENLHAIVTTRKKKDKKPLYSYT